MAFILRFFDQFLPESMRSTPHDLMRGYILLGFIFNNILISLLTAIGLLVILDLEHNTPIALALDSACLIAYLAALLLLKRTENYALCANFILLILTAVIFYGVAITGGYKESPILQLALQIPVMAFLLLGLRDGIFWLGATLLLCLLSYYGAVYHVGYVQLLQNEGVTQAMYILLQFVLVIIVGAVLIVYETLNGLLEKELQAERSKLEHWASHDDLTGVANRFEFFRRLKAHIQEAGEREQNIGIVYVDLDDFKPVNDTHGHRMGDETLRIIAERLQQVLRLSDTTARLGGDEFGLILPGVRVPGDIEQIMPKLLHCIRQPIQVEDNEITVRGSCGVAVYPTHSRDYNELCSMADTAMYQAKLHRDSYLIYTANMEKRPD
ncbi:MAG: hypothetical protein Hals2KO_27110 [Halioglobus sp.]